MGRVVGGYNNRVNLTRYGSVVFLSTRESDVSACCNLKTRRILVIGLSYDACYSMSHITRTCTSY